MDELPRKLKKKEADITPKVMDWFDKNYPHSVAVELKVGNNIVKDHQLAALNKIADGTFKYKLPDMGNRNPFDFIVLKKGVVPMIVLCSGRACLAQPLDEKPSFIFEIN